MLTSDANWKKPLKWSMMAKRRGQSMTYGEAVAVYGSELPECEAHEWDNRTTEENNAWLREHGVDPFRRPRVFCASLADVCEDWDGPILNNKGHELFWAHSREPHESPFKWIGDPECAGGETPVSLADVRARLFKLIDATPNLDWLLLTKRPENIARMWREKDGRGWLDDIRPNVWLGTTVENQEQADKRIPELLKCRILAPVLFLSCEPLLGAVEFSDVSQRSDCVQQLGKKALAGIDWVITGAESGPGARPSDLAWHESIVSQCKSAGVAVFVKQLQLSGKLVTDVNAFPESLRVQEFPARRD